MSIQKITPNNLTEYIKDINDNFYELPPVIVNNIPPEKWTEAQTIGQKYFDTTGMNLYSCIEIILDNSGEINENTFYNWEKVVGKNYYPVIVGNSEPLDATHAEGVGQLYINSFNNFLYLCADVLVSEEKYNWVLIAVGNLFPIIVCKNGIIEQNIAEGVGQLLIDEMHTVLYMCIKKEANNDIWCPINSSPQKIETSLTTPLVNIENFMWFKKNSMPKNTDGETAQVPVIL